VNAVVVVGLNVASTLPGVLTQLPDGLHVVVVDDGSTDNTAFLVPDTAELVRHTVNRGYGAAQKSGYAAALAAGAERIALVHGDDQYRVDDVLALLDALDDADVALGSRFLQDGGETIPGWRRWGNRGLTTLFNRTLSTSFTDLHTGARAFRAETLRTLPLTDFSDDYLFDQQLLVGAVRAGLRVTERPCRVTYDPRVQSISLGRSVIYGLGCVRTILG
jgi:glycosyltransferase involved in cell wall biosynthesis